MPDHALQSRSSERGPSPRYITISFVFLWLVATVSPGAADGTSDRGFFGLTPRATENGVTVHRVTAGGPAEKAGIEPGDFLIAIAGKPVASLSQAEIPEVFTAFRVGETVEVVYRRDGRLATARVELASVPPLTLAEQRRIAEIERRIQAGEVMDRILAASDLIELSRSAAGEVRYRPDAETPWKILDPYVGEKFEPVLQFYLRDGRDVVRLRIERADDGSVRALVPID